MRLLFSFIGAVLVTLALFALMLVLIMPKPAALPQPTELVRVSAVSRAAENPIERPATPPRRPQLQPLPEPLVESAPAVQLTPPVPQRSPVALAQPSLPPSFEDAAKTQVDANREAEVSAADIAEAAPSTIRIEELEPLSVISPAYPARARAAGIEGYVTLSFSVNPEGRVENVRVLDAEPPGVFERTARQAISRSRFKPRREEGVAVSREVTKTLTFRLNNEG